MQVKIFLSSVRGGLEVERDSLPGLIAAAGHEPRRFEDYTAARSGPSREACLRGVEDADVYLLLLGERYGDALPETGLSPTEEEFTVAKRRGIPILVFRKRGVTPETAQDEFIKRIEAYATGRFRRSFAAPTDLLAEVVSAIKELEATPPTLDWEPLATPVSTPWRTADRYAGQRANGILESHAIPAGSVRPLSATVIDALPSRLARTGRASGLFREDEALQTEPGESAVGVHVRREGRTLERGIRVTTHGIVTVWEELPSDMLGSIISKDDLARRIAGQLRVAGDLLPNVPRVAVAAGLHGIGWTAEGNPADVGRRTGGTIPGFGKTTDQALVEARDSIPRELVGPSANEIAQELAMRVLLRFREVMR
jgi:hypothetical protein